MTSTTSTPRNASASGSSSDGDHSSVRPADANAATATRPPSLAEGKIITFYSYKGGTGRSMALANVAWILASNRQRVLVVDWDLEAPGLHRYFRPFLIDKELTSSEGLIDFVIDFADEAITPLEASNEAPDAEWYVERADVMPYVLSLNYPDFPAGGKIDLLPAGRQGATYAARVNSFNWQNFYDRLGGGAFLEAARRHMRDGYDYILIDSRTGVSDTAGICTVQMPDDLVVCFTYNNQSIEGASAVAHSSVAGRRKQAGVIDGRGFQVFPVPTRVEQSEFDKLSLRQNFAWSLFDDLLEHIAPTERKTYWNKVEVPYLGYYGYEELLSVFKDDPGDPKKMLAAMMRLTNYLSGGAVNSYKLLSDPKRVQEILEEYARTPQLVALAQSAASPSSSSSSMPPRAPSETEIEEQARLADAAFARLTFAEQVTGQNVWLRLVRLAQPGEAGENTRLRCPLKDFTAEEIVVIEQFAKVNLLTLMRDRATGEETVEIANDNLLRRWPGLQELLERNRDFLLWRQRLRAALLEWEQSGRKPEFLLPRAASETAANWLASSADKLNEAEQAFINESNRHLAQERDYYTQTVATQVLENYTQALASQAPPSPPPYLTEHSAPVSYPSPPRASGFNVVRVALAALIVAGLLGGVWWYLAAKTSYNANTNANSQSPVSGNAERASSLDAQGTANAQDAENSLSKGDYDAALINYGAAIDKYTRAVAAAGTSEAALPYRQKLAVVYVARGNVWLKKGDNEAALRDFNAALEQDNSNVAATVARGNAFRNTGQLDQALADYNRAVQLDPNRADAYLNRGLAYQLQPSVNYGLVFADYSRALDINPNLAEAYLYQGQAYLATSNKENARLSLAKADQLATDPAISVSANDLLRQLGAAPTATPTPAPAAPPKVFLQFNDKDDADTVAAVARSLGGVGFNVQGRELRSEATTGDVRYYYPEDAFNAQIILNAVTGVLAGKGVSLKLKLLALGARYKNVPRGNIEVWLPSLKSARVAQSPAQTQTATSTPAAQQPARQPKPIEQQYQPRYAPTPKPTSRH